MVCMFNTQVYIHAELNPYVNEAIMLENSQKKKNKSCKSKVNVLTR